MKKHLILFVCILALAFATTCENQQVIGLLRAPSELVSLEIVAYSDDLQLEGGASMEPGFTTSVFDYTVFVSKDANRFTVNAAIKGNGSVEIMNEEDQETGTEFDYLDDEPKMMILTVEREYMQVAQYRVTVLREGTVPTATGVEISVTPGIGTFFLGRGVLPEFEVTAHLPAAGGELSYQWYMNTQNSNRGGSRINGATGTTYKMLRGETLIARTVYYYAEIINTIDGKTGVTESNPCRVTFVDKNELHEKSRAQDYMVNIPQGNVTLANTGNDVYWNQGTFNPVGLEIPWETPGFSMGKYLVTWELWKFVFDYAQARDANYSFSHVGNQGAYYVRAPIDGTYINPHPIGNALHPVTMINLRDAVVWCNAYSEMNGLEPVYVDSDGNVLRDSRLAVELLVDKTKITGNGYRLPTTEEWFYAGRGANPRTSPPWTDQYPGTNSNDWVEKGKYMWSYTQEAEDSSDYYDPKETGEVGSMLPNQIWNGSQYVDGLYDMLGMMIQWTLSPYQGLVGQYTVVGTDYKMQAGWWCFYTSANNNAFQIDLVLGFLAGLRLARNKE